MHYLRPGTLQLATLPPLSLYVHLPWRLKKCPYCDFNSHEIAGEVPETRYLDALGADLAQAFSSAPPHLSVYPLPIEPNTYFAKFPPVVPDEDSAFAMLDRITEVTSSAGLARYEVSAFAKPGHRCRHNLNYWQFGDY